MQKRKRHAYLQSASNVPQTRQTTARLNGPSPPLGKTGPRAGTAKSKSLIQPRAAGGQSAAKPNILRNGEGGRQPRDLNGKPIKQEEKPKPEPKMGKAVHIPGLPSGLTIERIENDSTVCISCRNPGASQALLRIDPPSRGS